MESESKSRRDMLRLASASLALPLSAAESPKPFKVSIPQSTVDRILNRVKQAQWADRLDASDWRYGTNWDYMKDLAQYWTTRFDWRKAEAGLNRYPQFLARVADYEIHFYQVRPRGANGFPILLTHGWPGSVVEFQEVIKPLTDAGFDLVIPSLPGFGFSSKPKGKPIGPVTTAGLWHRLMTEVLGYSKYGAQGGDWGMAVTMQLARQFPQQVAGIHLNAAGAGIAGIPEAEQTEEERAWVRAGAAYRATELDYFNEQQHKPQTLTFALADSPLGWAAWMAEKLKIWSDVELSKDQVLTNAMFYLVTDTVATGVWFYRGSAEDPPPARGRITVPVAFASFPKEMLVLNPPRRFLERDLNLVQYTKMPRGGHFAAFEQPQLYAEDVARFFRTVA